MEHQRPSEQADGRMQMENSSVCIHCTAVNRGIYVGIPDTPEQRKADERNK